MDLPQLRSYRRHARTAGRVPPMTRKKQPATVVDPEQAAATAAAAAAFLEAQKITTTVCPECGAEAAGINGRYVCFCGWVNNWHEGHRDLPTAEDDPDWPGHAQTA